MAERKRIDPGALNDLMEFDHVIEIHDDGTVSEPSGVYAPDLNAISDGQGSHTADTDQDLRVQARRQGWGLASGWTGQYGYSGPCMHRSEYIGGSLADHILATPGLWVAVVVYEDDDSEPDGWALAYRPVS